MSIATPTGAKQKSTVFETILSSPDMSEKSKINLLSRQNMIVFVHLLEAGMANSTMDATDEIMSAIPVGTLEEIAGVRDEILRMGRLTET